MDCSLLGFSVPGLLQARILEWVAMASSRIFLTQGWKLPLLCLLHWQADSLPLRHLGSLFSILNCKTFDGSKISALNCTLSTMCTASTCKKVKKCLSLSYVQLFATPWTIAHQAPLSMGFSRQEYWSG